MRILLTISWLFGLATGTYCVADSSLDYAIIEAGEPVESKRVTVAIGAGGVAVSDTSGSGRARVLYRTENDDVVFIDHAHREYTVMTEAWLKDAGERAERTFEDMQQRLEERSDTMSPQARKQLAQAQTMMRLMPLMGGLYGGGSANKATYSRSYRRSEFNGLVCEQYEELVDGERRRIVCLSLPESIGLDAADARIFDRFIKLLARMYIAGLVEFGFEMPLFMLYDDQLQGVPVAASNPDNDGYVLTGKAGDSYDESLFDIPTSYLEAQIPLFAF